MKRKSYVARITAVCLAGALILSGCGSSGAAAESPAIPDVMEENEETGREPVSKEPSETENAGTIEQEGSVPAQQPGGAFVTGENDTTGSFDSAADIGGVNDIYEAEEKRSMTESYLDSCYSYDWEPGENASEEYSEWEEKGFLSVMKEPLSTFAADVDTASYSNLRRLIREGYTLDDIPEGAVRIEELLNYFNYDHKGPEEEEPFGITIQTGRCPWNEQAELVMIGLKTQEIDYSQAPPSNLVFLLDVSGSMGDPDKLPLLQESFGLLAEHLRNRDRISIVTYAEDTKTVLDGARGNETQKIVKTVNSLSTGGGTYGSKGIETAYALAEEHFIQGGNNRIILATDGDMNIGMTTEEELEDLITAKKESGIFLSVLGFGTGNIKDNKMETLADRGNGNYAYIDSLQEAKKVLVEEMTATLLTICKDVKFQVEFNPAVVESYRLLGYENRAMRREDFADDTKDAGEIGAGHSVTVLYEILLKGASGSSMSEKEIEDLKYSKEYRKELDDGKSDDAKRPLASKEEWLTLSIRYKRPAEKCSTILEYPIGYESYTMKPNEDYVFAAAVAEFGLLASHSRYPEGAALYHVDSVLKSLELTDTYKKEFVELVGTIYDTMR